MLTNELNKQIPRNSLLNVQGIALLKTAKYLCYGVPLLFIVYAYVTSIQTNQSLWEKVEHNPIFTVLFLAAMLQPFVGLTIDLGLKSLSEGTKPAYIHQTFMLLAFAELLLGNIIGCLLIGLGSYLHKKQTADKLHHHLFKTNSKRFYFAIGLACFLFLFSILCLWIFIKVSSI